MYHARPPLAATSGRRAASGVMFNAIRYLRAFVSNVSERVSH